MIDDLAAAVSDPANTDYSPEHPAYLPTADPSQPYHTTDHTSEGSSSPPGVMADIRRITSGIIGDLGPGGRLIALQFNEYLGEATATGPGWAIDSYGDDGPPRTLWEYYDHPTMMQAITNNADAAAVNEQARGWSNAATDLPKLARALTEASDPDQGWGGGWKGPAADAATRQFAQIAEWVADVARGAFSAGQQQSERAFILEETQKQMAAVPPVEFDQRAANARLDQMTDPVQIGRQVEEDQQVVQQQREAHARAADLMNLYDRALTASGTPPYFPPPPLNSPDPAPTGAEHEATKAPAPATANRASVDDRTPREPPPSGHQPSGHAPASTPATNPATSTPSASSPDAMHVVHPAEGTTVAAATASPPSNGNTPDTSPRNSYPGALPAGPDTDSRRPFPGLLAPGGPSAPDRGPAVGKPPGTSSGTPGGHSGTLPPGTSARSASGATGRPGTVGRAPLATHPGAAPFTGGFRRKQDDEQRPPSPYTDLDTPTIFETDERTAPPTIGVHDDR